MKSFQMLESQRLPSSIHWQQVFDMDEQIEVRIVRLESDVGHIQRDVADIKVELRRTNDKIDAMDEKLTAKIDGLEEKFNAMKVWAMGMYFALAGSLLLVMAKGFKWI